STQSGVLRTCRRLAQSDAIDRPRGPRLPAKTSAVSPPSRHAGPAPRGSRNRQARRYRVNQFLQRVDKNDEPADRHEEQPTMIGRMTDANRVDAELLRTAERSTKLAQPQNKKHEWNLGPTPRRARGETPRSPVGSWSSFSVA